MFIIREFARWTAGLVAAIALAGVASAQQWEIVPGESIGSVRLGMSLAEAREVLLSFGQVTEIQASNNQHVDVCAGTPDLPVRLCVLDAYVGRSQAVRTSGLVAQIITYDSRFMLRSGTVSVGFPLLDAFALLGAPSYSRTIEIPGAPLVEYTWEALGISMTTKTRGGRIVIDSVSVFKKLTR